MAADRHFGTFNLQYIDKLLDIKYRRQQCKFGDSSCNRIGFIDDLKIQDGGLSPCWILAFAVCRVNYRKLNSEENKPNQVILAEIYRKLLAIQKCKIVGDRCRMWRRREQGINA